MTPEQESLLREIHASLVGPLGQEEDGLIYKVRNHDTRIVSLERWRWLIIGGGLVLGFLVELWAKAVK